MLLGEHAVLHKELAIVCAIAQRMRVSLTPINSKIVSIRSKLGEYQSFIDQIEPKAPFSFVLTAIKQFEDQLPSGFILDITAEFSDTIGFASSAAVTVATLAALYRWLNGEKPSPLQLFKLAKSVILTVQGRGSGADIAACIFGGTLAYRIEPLEIIQLAHNPLITAVYSGSKMPTTEVIAKVNQAMAKAPDRYQKIFQLIGECSERAKQAILQANWPMLAKAMQDNQQLMSEMQLTNPALQLIIDTLHANPNVLAAKISGSGLGDCAVGLINTPSFSYPINVAQAKMGVQAIPVTISPEGVMYE
jgi:mevalonate kinase